MNDQELLKEIYQNANTGIYSIQTLLPKVDDAGISQTLGVQRQKMEEIAKTAEDMMQRRKMEIPDSPAWHKAGIWTGTQFNTFLDSSPSHLAEMVIQGDTMGITQLVGSLNDCPNGDVDIVGLGTELVNIQRRSIETLKKYL